MSLYYTYLTDESGAILTDESGAWIYIAVYPKNPNPWRDSHDLSPKTRTAWDANPTKPPDVWRSTPKPTTEWGSTAKPDTLWRTNTEPKDRTDWSDV